MAAKNGIMTGLTNKQDRLAKYSDLTFISGKYALLTVFFQASNARR